MKKILSLVALTAVLAACQNPTGTTGDSSYGTDYLSEETLQGANEQSLNDAYILAAAPKYYIGTSYKVDGVQYMPAEDFNYNQTGIVGIIPVELNGSKTSNGETYDSSQMLATSKTLPLPTVARVTNLDNGASVVVRINNRGPFLNDRIMDVSSAVAEKLEIKDFGKVQIQVLPEETKIVKDATVAATQPIEAVPAEKTTVTTETTTVVDPNAEVVKTTTTETTTVEPVVIAPAGDYEIQVAAFYSEDSAASLAERLSTYGNLRIVHESDMYKVRFTGLDAAQARQTIDILRSDEGMAPGLLKSGRWVNPDSI